MLFPFCSLCTAICASRLRFASLGLCMVSSNCPKPATSAPLRRRSCSNGSVGSKPMASPVQVEVTGSHTVTINATKKKYEMKKTVPKTLPKTSSKCKTSEKVYESISFTASYYFIKHVDIFRPCSQDCRYLICRWSSKLMAVRDQASNSSFGVAASTDRRVLWVRESWHCPNVPCNPVLVQVRIDSNR